MRPSSVRLCSAAAVPLSGQQLRSAKGSWRQRSRKALLRRIVLQEQMGDEATLRQVLQCCNTMQSASLRKQQKP